MNKYAFLIGDDIPIFTEDGGMEESTGHRALYRLVPPCTPSIVLKNKNIPETVEYVVLSAVLIARDPRNCSLTKCGKETLVFKSDANGKVNNLAEIDGVIGTLSHAMTLSRMGYTLICDRQLEED